MVKIGGMDDRGAAIGRDHGNGALSESEIAVDHDHLVAGAGQQDSRRAPVADAIARGAPARDNRHLMGRSLATADVSWTCAYRRV